MQDFFYIVQKKDRLKDDLIFQVTPSGILSNFSSEFFTNEVRNGLAKLYHVFRYLKE